MADSPTIATAAYFTITPNFRLGFPASASSAETLGFSIKAPPFSKLSPTRTVFGAFSSLVLSI